MEYYLMAFQKFAEFDGRSRRREYWMFTLVNIIISMVVGVILSKSLGGVYSLVIFIPQLSLTFRRLHDINKSGLFVLVNLIPLVGWIWFLILMATDSDMSSNEYGACPK